MILTKRIIQIICRAIDFLRNYNGLVYCSSYDIYDEIKLRFTRVKVSVNYGTSTIENFAFSEDLFVIEENLNKMLGKPFVLCGECPFLRLVKNGNMCDICYIYAEKKEDDVCCICLENEEEVWTEFSGCTHAVHRRCSKSLKPVECENDDDDEDYYKCDDCMTEKYSCPLCKNVSEFKEIKFKY
jgi:hypothetical protein